MQHAVINDWCVLNQHTSGLYLKGDHIYCILQTNDQSLQKKVKLVSDQRNDLDYMDEIPPSDVVRKEFSLNSCTAE